jgi:hypothetical protein
MLPAVVWWPIFIFVIVIVPLLVVAWMRLRRQRRDMR